MTSTLVRTAVDGAFILGGGLARRLPLANPKLYGVECIRDVDYVGDGDPEHRLDVYRPIDRGAECPAVLYVHGGAWRMLSKDSHFMMGLAFARAGYIVFNINYRLAPRSPFPSALEDVLAAYAYVLRRGPEFGAAEGSIAIAGESAGANLALAATVATCFERPEPWAAKAFELGVVPSAVAPACGLLQVSDMDRFGRRRRLPRWLRNYLVGVPEDYVGKLALDALAPQLADPLLILEGDEAPARALPPFFLGVGTRDPILDDTRRLAAALARREVRHELRYYVGGRHAFHAVVPRKLAREYWRHQLEFLAQTLR